MFDWKTQGNLHYVQSIALESEDRPIELNTLSAVKNFSRVFLETPKSGYNALLQSADFII